MQDHEKIAVGEAVRAGYRFGFGEFGAVFGAAWLPLLLAVAATTAVSLFGVSTYMASADALGDANAAMVGFVTTPVNSVISLIFSSIATAGLVSVALARREPSSVYFSLDPTVLRMIAARFLTAGIMLALFALLYGLFLLLAYGLGLGTSLPQSSPEGVLTFPLQQLLACGVALGQCPAKPVIAALVVFGLLEVVAFIYVMLRLTYFLPAVVVNETRIGIARAWSLSRGNAGRLFAIYLATTLPVAVVGGIALRFVASLLVESAMPTSQTIILRLALQGMPAALIGQTLVGIVLAIISTGIVCGAQVRAYSQLTGADVSDVF